MVWNRVWVCAGWGMGACDHIDDDAQIEGLLEYAWDNPWERRSYSLMRYAIDCTGKPRALPWIERRRGSGMGEEQGWGWLRLAEVG